MRLRPRDGKNLSIIGFSGSPQRPSKTRALVGKVLSEIEKHYGVKGRLFDLVDLMPEIGTVIDPAQAPPKVAEVLKLIENADVLVVGSPTYKGSYTGLFKHVFDLIAPTALVRVPVVITGTGGGDRHALSVEHQMRPLFGFFMANQIPTTVYASGSDFTGEEITSAPLIARIDAAVGDLAPWLESHSK